jgi:hypothetical protein
MLCSHVFSKFAWLLPVQDATSASRIHALKQKIFATFSVRDVVVSEKKCFVSINSKGFVSL